MADLKLGTTLGGAAIWSASNLPLLPSGGQITYKGWRIYTENDRPTAEDIGALSLANGGTVNNDTTFTKI
ncbi:long tail fiber protein distal subunit [Citrobacter phage IME-CF2]|uniref:Tail fibers n=1 Tax=Citrobacter phage IME-CF2 TaxID=1673887 RepID=A0A0K0QSE9_9CAUD|nr:long tail fiber protein distal subunit [Citrobacter phage IME-CF2]AKR16047.1 tail fibers [Citrobacter phage IME-CF2]